MKCPICGFWVSGLCVQVARINIDFELTEQGWAHLDCVVKEGNE